MKKTGALLLLLASFVAVAQQKTIQEKLGYSKDTKLLIIHADDLGVSHSENMASIDVMKNGVVNSASIMVPCPWFPEIANYAKENPNADLGLHLTLTSEWKFFKWGPVTSRNEVRSLIDANGYFNEGITELMKNGRAEEVEKELRAQIELAKRSGVDPTHFDAHMAGAISTAEFFKAYLKLSREYKVPVLIVKEISQMFGIDMNHLVDEKDVVVDRVIIASGDDYKKGMQTFYSGALKSIQPGLTCLLLHAAYDNEEMQAVTTGHVDYGAAWRQADVNFFKSEACKKIIADEKIKLITWKEIRDKLYR
jgi:chitin disaccharide deacetylase